VHPPSKTVLHALAYVKEILMLPRSSWLTVRDKTTRELHSLALRLRRLEAEDQQEWTEGQERLFYQIIAELEWRSCRARRRYPRCYCELCFVGHLEGDDDDPLNC
jgi:hypothetical protein